MEESIKTQFCEYCQCEHLLTTDFWFFYKQEKPVCRIKRKAYDKEYYRKNAERKKQAAAAFRKNNPDIIYERNKIYVEQNREKVRRQIVSYRKKRSAEDSQFKLLLNLRSRLGTAIKGKQKVGSVIRDLGCTIPELKAYLEAKFQEGMTWENHGTHGWHLDHIIPLSSFDLTDREQFLKACHYTNLQPLWAEENLQKHAKTPEEWAELQQQKETQDGNR